MQKQGDSLQVMQSNKAFVGKVQPVWGIAPQEKPGPLEKRLKESSGKGQSPGNGPTWKL